ncbi:DMT family transporter [Thalassospira sp.]|uniref:DMT family transporter n=1 Tax=Thalassospira sp. TaxID=1912094 RepID=UPI000C37A9F0|nr:DMT family transporter [Thalassospira sp.]MBC07211.1 permease [Thalassospira sp.]
MKATAATPHRDRLPLAVGTIIFTVFALSLGDALIKQSSSQFVIWQIFVIRSGIAIPFLVGYLAIRSPSALRLGRAFGWTALRSLLLVIMWVCYYLSLPHLTLSVAAATYYTLPIFITLLSAVVTQTAISKTGWFAVVIGFAGVLFILRPDAGNFNGYALLPLCSAMLYACAMILTRTKCRGVHPIKLSLALNIAFVVVGAVAAVVISMLSDDMRQGFLLAPWTSMTLNGLGTMAILAASILIGSIGAAIAYQNGPPAMIGTFDFAYVGFSFVWGVLFFAETPDALSLIGIIMIVAAGIMSLRQ